MFIYTTLIRISMDNSLEVGRVFRGQLWGYRNLVKMLFEVVGPALVVDRERKIREREEAELQRTLSELKEKLPEVVAEDNGSIAPTRYQSSEVLTLDKRSQVLEVRQSETLLDN